MALQAAVFARLDIIVTTQARRNLSYKIKPALLEPTALPEPPKHLICTIPPALLASIAWEAML